MECGLEFGDVARPESRPMAGGFEAFAVRRAEPEYNSDCRSTYWDFLF